MSPTPLYLRVRRWYRLPKSDRLRLILAVLEAHNTSPEQPLPTIIDKSLKGFSRRDAVGVTPASRRHLCIRCGRGSTRTPCLSWKVYIPGRIVEDFSRRAIRGGDLLFLPLDLRLYVHLTCVSPSEYAALYFLRPRGVEIDLRLFSQDGPRGS